MEYISTFAVLIVLPIVWGYAMSRADDKTFDRFSKDVKT